MQSSVCTTILVLCLFCATATWGAPPETFVLDPTTGNIDGTTAAVVYPARYEDHSVAEILSPAGFTVHLVAQENQDLELVFPSGQWFLPVPGHTYQIWLEGDGLMTPYTNLMIYSGGKFKGRGMSTALPVAPAGRVTLPTGIEPNPKRSFRLLFAGPYHKGDLAYWELSRRCPSDAVGEGLLMPAGPVVAALWDEKRQAYAALSRPFTVVTHKTVAAPLERPRGAAFLVLRLQRDTRALSVADFNVEPVVVQNGVELAPDVKVPTTANLYAIWYDLEPGTIEVKADSPQEILLPRQLDLLPGRIEHLHEQLVPKPDLEVELILPDTLRDEALNLRLRELPEGRDIVSVPLSAETFSHRFEALPPVLVEVELETSLGPFKKEVDLRSGEDALVQLEPELILVTGTVRYGEDGHPARLSFRTVASTDVEAVTDDHGVYEIVLLEPLRSVEVELSDVAAEPYFDFFTPPITSATTLDFDFPATEFKVQVIDAVTGQGIKGASVVVRNLFTPPKSEADEPSAGELSAGKEPEKAVMQQVATDDEGLAALPPLRLGTLELKAQADGYAHQQQPVTAQVIDLEKDQTFMVALEPIGETVALFLELPGGAPAVGAEILLIDSLTTGQTLFSARTGEDGSVAAPRKKGGFLLVKHPSTAFLVREWPPQKEDEELTWALPAAAPRPLSIHVTDASGEAAPRAEVALWLDGRRLTGIPLAWLTGARPMTDLDGFWQATHLPQDNLAILAWERTLREQASSGSLDGLAVDVAYPWPDMVEVAAIQ